MYRLKTREEFLADGWSEQGSTFFVPPNGGTPLNMEMYKSPPSNHEIGRIITDGRDDCPIMIGDWCWTPGMFTLLGNKGATKRGEIAEPDGCICAMRKHRFSGHMRYCPAYS